MSDFYRFKKLNLALNEWQRIKYACYQEVSEFDKRTMEIALAAIGRNGYRATKGIDLMDSLIGTRKTETVVKAAANMRKIAKELGVNISDQRERWE